MIERITLGTAQFGLDYGIANKNGKIAKEEAFKILEYAHKVGIDSLDTAYSYGDSEKTIGEFIIDSKTSFNIISKMPPVENDNTSPVEEYCKETLARLRQTSIYGYLVHKFDNIVSIKGLWPKLESLKLQNLVERIGASIYRTEELDYLINEDIHFDIIQLPYNVFDRRFEKYFPILKKRNVEIYARSVFLQGLFFLKMEEIDRKFKPARDAVEKLHSIAAGYSIPIYSLCLCFVLLNSSLGKVIIGVDSLEHLNKNVASLGYIDKVKSIYETLKMLETSDEEIILPYNWKR